METLNINLGKSGTLSVDVLCTFNHREQKWFCHESHDRTGRLLVRTMQAGIVPCVFRDI